MNIAAALVWATTHVIGGVAIGASLHLVAQIAALVERGRADLPA
ncbi:hypothetical protein [Halomonas aquatica]|uniref:Uncharacterized protein n=1 Tax=Halomonas aquatica TaxID=3151123 RepID=A0ABV1NER2_9GAMM